jgi:hypothetical protein
MNYIKRFLNIQDALNDKTILSPCVLKVEGSKNPNKIVFGNFKEDERIKLIEKDGYVRACSTDYLAIESLSESGTISIVSEGTVSPISLEYSMDSGNTWYDVSSGIDISVGDKVLIKGNNNNFSSDTENYYHFISSNPLMELKVSGNIMSLLDETLESTALTINCRFVMLFSELNIIDASLLRLTATTLSNGCYAGMFNGCTSLTTAPELPATTLSNGCYIGMFNGCTSLQTAPELPATTLATGCYMGMFVNCSNLNNVNVAFTDWNDVNSCTSDWLNGVSPTGTFTCPSALPQTIDTSHIPSGWTITTY